MSRQYGSDKYKGNEIMLSYFRSMRNGEPKHKRGYGNDFTAKESSLLDRISKEFNYEGSKGAVKRRKESRLTDVSGEREIALSYEQHEVETVRGG